LETSFAGHSNLVSVQCERSEIEISLRVVVFIMTVTVRHLTHGLTSVLRSTRPSTICGTVNEYQHSAE